MQADHEEGRFLLLPLLMFSETSDRDVGAVTVVEVVVGEVLGVRCIISGSQHRWPPAVHRGGGRQQYTGMEAASSTQGRRPSPVHRRGGCCHYTGKEAFTSTQGRRPPPLHTSKAGLRCSARLPLSGPPLPDPPGLRNSKGFCSCGGAEF